MHRAKDEITALLATRQLETVIDVAAISDSLKVRSGVLPSFERPRPDDSQCKPAPQDRTASRLCVPQQMLDRYPHVPLRAARQRTRA